MLYMGSLFTLSEKIGIEKFSDFWIQYKHGYQTEMYLETKRGGEING